MVYVRDALDEYERKLKARVRTLWATEMAEDLDLHLSCDTDPDGAIHWSLWRGEDCLMRQDEETNRIEAWLTAEYHRLLGPPH